MTTPKKSSSKKRTFCVVYVLEIVNICLSLPLRKNQIKRTHQGKLRKNTKIQKYANNDYENIRHCVHLYLRGHTCWRKTMRKRRKGFDESPRRESDSQRERQRMMTTSSLHQACMPSAACPSHTHSARVEEEAESEPYSERKREVQTRGEKTRLAGIHVGRQRHITLQGLRRSKCVCGLHEDLGQYPCADAWRSPLCESSWFPQILF